MLMAAVEAYLAVRRSTGFQLKGVEHYLRNFAAFAMERGEQYIVARTAVDWAGAVTCEAQRQHRLGIVRYSRYERPFCRVHRVSPAR